MMELQVRRMAAGRRGGWGAGCHLCCRLLPQLGIAHRSLGGEGSCWRLQEESSVTGLQSRVWAGPGLGTLCGSPLCCAQLCGGLRNTMTPGGCGILRVPSKCSSWDPRWRRATWCCIRSRSSVEGGDSPLFPWKRKRALKLLTPTAEHQWAPGLSGRGRVIGT